jgi:hypothetical protein
MISKTTCLALLTLGFDFTHALQLKSKTGAKNIFQMPDKLEAIMKKVNNSNIKMINWGAVDDELEKSKQDEEESEDELEKDDEFEKELHKYKSGF